MTGIKSSLITLLRFSGIGLWLTLAASFGAPSAVVTSASQSMLNTANGTGKASTVSAAGPIDRRNPFFQSLGTNGRACVHCHQPDQGWSITPAGLQQVFAATDGLDPVFRPNDGTNSPNADVSTVEKRRAAYSMLLNKGVIRVGLPIPANAEFTLSKAEDPYLFASQSELSLFRRPLPGTNVRFVSAVMWDGRNTFVPIQQASDLKSNLKQQASGAVLGHAQAAVPPSDAQLESIVDFVMSLHTSQVWDENAGSLLARGAKGGPQALAAQEFYIGINDPLGNNPTGKTFDSSAMQLFTSWASLKGPGNDPADFGDNNVNRNSARAAVARGEQIFNTHPIAISGVAGLNDALNAPTIQGTCTTCHDAPNVGNHSVAMALNIGIADESRRTPDMPLYTLRNKTTGAIVRTTDPGRALITGKWADIGKFKGPVLRALPTRPPYFHDGSAATLSDVVNFYNQRFSIGLTEQQRQDLIAFLRTL
jgi:cytochrome c peroxidase